MGSEVRLGPLGWILFNVGGDDDSEPDVWAVRLEDITQVSMVDGKTHVATLYDDAYVRARFGEVLSTMEAGMVPPHPAPQADAGRLGDAVVDELANTTAKTLFEADPHQFSSRPCQTCKVISALLERPFGCKAKATASPTAATVPEDVGRLGDAIVQRVEEELAAMDALGIPGTPTKEEMDLTRALWRFALHKVQEEDARRHSCTDDGCVTCGFKAALAGFNAVHA